MMGWCFAAAAVAFVVMGLVVPFSLSEELLQHAFLAVREPFTILRGWSEKGFRITQIKLRSGLAALGMTRHNAALRIPVQFFLAATFFVSTATFALNLIPTFAGLIGLNTGIVRQIASSLEVLMAVELMVAPISAGILFFELLGVTKLRSDFEGMKPPHNKWFLVACMASIVVGSAFLTHDAGRLRANAFDFDPAATPAAATQTTAGLLLGPSTGQDSRIPADRQTSSSPAVDQNQEGGSGTYKGTSQSLMTWLPVLSLASGMASFMAVPHALYMITAVPLFAFLLGLLGSLYLLGDTGERMTNVGYNLARASVVVLAHVGDRFGLSRSSSRNAGVAGSAAASAAPHPASGASVGAGAGQPSAGPDIGGTTHNHRVASVSDAPAAGNPSGPSSGGATPNDGSPASEQAWNPLGVDLEEAEEV